MRAPASVSVIEEIQNPRGKRVVVLRRVVGQVGQRALADLPARRVAGLLGSWLASVHGK